MTKIQIKKWWSYINNTKKAIKECEKRLVGFKKKYPNTRLFLEDLIDEKKKLLIAMHQLSLDGELPPEIKKSYRILVLLK